LERAGYLVAVSFRDTIVVIPPADSFHLSPWTLVNHSYPVAYLFHAGREPYPLPTDRTLLLQAVRTIYLIPRPARRVTSRAMSIVFRGLSVGGEHTCGLTPRGVALCWGGNRYGQLGIRTTADTTRATAVAGGFSFAELTAGGTNTCGLTAAGVALCWGLNAGHSDSQPRRVVGLRFAQLSAGNGHTCGRTAAGSAFCWGSTSGGRLGDGAPPVAGMSGLFKAAPVAVAGTLRFAEISAGGAHTCGRTADGKAFCWGANAYGQLGDGSKVDRPTPVPVAGGRRFVELRALGYDHTCGRTADGRAFCWGMNREGQLGDSTTTERATPTAVAGGLRFVELSAGNYHTCGRTKDGLGFCWGGSNNGERGDGIMMGQASTTPAPVAGGLRFIELRAGGGHTCGRTKEGATFCWGWNGHGELGDGSRLGSLGPVQVVPLP
jgi:alpha-tubulin suppressor-like RCC1 family protein